MKEGFFKIFVAVFVLIVLVSFFSSSNDRQLVATNYNVNVQRISANGVSAADGLDLQAVGGLVKRARSAEDFETLLNSEAEGINNLDLNEDGETDYIKVTEYGDDVVQGFSLSTELAQGQEQEIATIEIEKQSDTEAEVEVHGNQQIYGNNHYHRSRFSFTDALILSYLWRPHGFYSSRWGYGSYPPSYRRYSTVTPNTYRSRAASTRNSANMTSASSRQVTANVSSPNQGKSAANIRAPLRNPSTSQRSFQTRNPSRQVASGGFGRSSTASAGRNTRASTSRAPSRPSVRASSSSRSGSFRSGK